MAYSRNEYLQSLNRMRANYQSQGNPLVNREDDNGDVGNELSSFAYMQTEPVSTATEQASKVNRNDWQRTVDTIGSAKSNIREGVVNFLDDVADFAIVTGSLLGGIFAGVGTWLFSDSHDFTEGWDTVTQGAQKATQFEWEPYVNEFLNQIDMEQAALSGDLFNGEWAQRWADIGDLEKNKQHIQELHQNSWASDWGEFGQGVQQVEQGVGYMLPSILLGVLTGGSSTAVQVGVQAAVAGGTALGSGFEQASKEGADYGHALLYGGTKGAVGAGIGALTTWVGGNVAASSGGTAVSNLGKKAGEQIFKTTGSKTAEVVTGKAIEIASQAGISGAKAFAMTMAEPAFKTLYNDKSLQESYSGENLNKTLELAKSSALTTMATSAVVGTLKEGAEFAKYGKDGYYAKYYTEKAQMMAVKDSKQLKKIQEYETSEKGKIEKRFNDGQITEKERDIALESLSKNVEAQTLKVKQNIENHTLKALQQGQEYVDRIQQQNKVKDLSKEDFRTLGRELRKKYHPDSGNVSSEKSALFNSTLDKLKALNANDNVGRLKVLNGIKDKEIKSDLTKLFPVSKYGNNEKVMTAFSNIKSNYKDLSTKLNFKWYETTNGDIGVKVDNNTDVTFGNDGKPYLLTYKGGDNNKEVQIKLESDKNAIVPTITKSNLSSTIEATSKINTAGFEIKLANIENKVLNIPEVESKGVNTKLPYSFSEDLNSKILNNTNSKEIMNFLDEGIKGKGQDNYVVQAKEDSKYFVIEPFKQNGNDKYGIITINSKTNEITDISVKNSVPSKVSGTIVPKVEKPQANVSYLKNDNGKPLVFNVADFKNDSDILDGTNKSFSAKPQEGENGEVVIYSKNPLKTLDIKKNIPFARVSKLFNIPSSLQKSYELKFDSKNELAPLNWVAKKSNLTIEQVIKKLGYDSIVKKDNSVTVFDGGKIVKRASQEVTNKSSKPITQPNRPSTSEIIKNSANLKHEKVYKVKTTNQIVENALTNVIDKLPQGAKISVPQTKANLKDFVFQELNLAKDRDLAVKNIVEQIEQAIVTFNDENNNEQKVTLSELGLKEDLTKAIEGLIDHKGELSEKSQWVKKYNDTVARYGKYVRERAELNSQYITAIKQQKTLDNIFKNAKQVNIGGDTSIKELSLYKQLTSNILLSNTRKNIAPSTFTKLVNNFSSYTEENFKDTFDPDIKNMVDQLSESFVDGKFPNREPTVGEMFLFNAIRGRIIVRCNDLKSKKTEAIHNQIRDTVLDASVALPNMTSGKFPKLINLANSTISVPVWFELHLGRDSYMTKLFTTEWNKHNSDFIAQRQKMYEEVLLELPKKAGLTSKKLTNTIKKTAIVLADRNGKEHKISIDYAAKAYCLYHSNNKEELLKTGLTIQNDKKSGKSYDFKLTESDYERMFKQIPEDVKNYLDLVLKDFCNGTLYDYRNKKNEAIFGVSMPRSDNYYWGERVGQVNTGSAPSALSGGYLSISNAKFLQTKVSNKNHFKWNSFLGDLTDVINDTTHWGEMSGWVDDVNHALNITVPEAGNHTLEYYLRQITGYDKFKDFMNKQIKGEPLSENKHTILSKIGNINQIALFGFNISASGKQLGSSPSFVLDPRVTIGNQIKSFFTGFKHIFHLKKIREELEQYSGFFVDRFENNDLINSFLVSEQAGKFQKFIAKVVLAPMEFIDSLIITTQGFEIATTILDEEIEQEIVSFKKGSAEYKKAHATLLSELVLRTQSNNVSMWKSPLRSGHKGEIERVVYGMFGSDNQNKIQAVIDLILGKRYSDARAKAYEDSSKNEKYTKEQREHFKEKAEEEHSYYSGKKTASKAIRILTSLIMSGMIVVGVRELVDRLKGKKDWDEKIDGGAIMGDLALETFVNWIPYVGTIANAIENNSDVSAFTVSELNELVDSMKLIAKAFETGDKTDVRKAVLSLVVNGLKLTGIPARNVYQLIMGMWYQFDKEGSLSAQAWVKGYKSSYMKTLYTTAITNGNTKRAKAQLGAWSMAYSTNITDETTLTELVRLSTVGYNATPSANMTSYTNDKGEKVSFTNAQANAFKTEYAKSNSVVKELLNIEGYKKQDDKAKASMISKIYSAYRESAKGKALGVVPNSKLAQLAYYAGNDIAMAKYILFMQQLSVIKDDEKKTRKEKVIAEINKIRGLSKSEKLLLAYLSGYSVAETNLDRLTTYLVGKGFKKTDALSFLGAKK